MPDIETVIGSRTEGRGTTVETDKGLTIYYQSEPERLYRVNGVEVPSVTTVLDILHKPALTWWGMKVGVEGWRTLVEKANDAAATGNWDLANDWWPFAQRPFRRYR